MKNYVPVLAVVCASVVGCNLLQDEDGDTTPVSPVALNGEAEPADDVPNSGDDSSRLSERLERAFEHGTTVGITIGPGGSVAAIKFNKVGELSVSQTYNISLEGAYNAGEVFAEAFVSEEYTHLLFLLLQDWLQAIEGGEGEATEYGVWDLAIGDQEHSVSVHWNDEYETLQLIQFNDTALDLLLAHTYTFPSMVAKLRIPPRFEPRSKLDEGDECE